MSSATDSSYDFATPLPPPEKTPAGPQTRVTEMACPQCGFLVVGKPRYNRCPECRAPLDDSVADRLQFSDAAWIRQSSWGALAMALAIVPHLFGAYRLGLAHDALRGAALHVMGAALTLAGIWLLTTSEQTHRPKLSLLGIATRWLAIASAILWAGATVTASRQGNVQWLMTPALLVMAGEAVTYGLFAGRLAIRIPHEGLAHQFRNFSLLLPPFFAFLIFCLYNDLSAYQQIFFCSFPLIGALAGLMLWVAATQVRFFLELRNAASAADTVVRKHFQAAEAAARAAAKAASSKPPQT